MVVEKHVIIRYPSAYYFFVNGKNTELHALIKKGFERAIEDGSYMELFNKHFSGQLEALNLDKRVVINIDNPDFPESSKQVMNDFWFESSY